MINNSATANIMVSSLHVTIMEYVCVNTSITIMFTYDFIHHTGPIYILHMNNLLIPYYKLTLISQKLLEHCGANHCLRKCTHINNKKIRVLLTLLKCSTRILSFAFCMGSLGCNGLSGYFSSR